jgi:hypothetical protein
MTAPQPTVLPAHQAMFAALAVPNFPRYVSGQSHQLTAALYAVADAIDAGVPPRVGELPGNEELKPVTDAVRPVLSVLGSGPHPT